MISPRKYFVIIQNRMLFGSKIDQHFHLALDKYKYTNYIFDMLSNFTYLIIVGRVFIRFGSSSHNLRNCWSDALHSVFSLLTGETFAIETEPSIWWLVPLFLIWSPSLAGKQKQSEKLFVHFIRQIAKDQYLKYLIKWQRERHLSGDSFIWFHLLLPVIIFCLMIVSVDDILPVPE